METTVTWIAVGIFVFFLAIGLCMGLIRGIKRSTLHFAFVIIAFVVAFFVTKPIAGALLEIKFPLDGGNYTLGQYIIKLLGFDISNFAAAGTFLSKLPTALVSPILFIILLLVFYVFFDIIYLIVARVAFGKKKEDFADNRAFRTYGGAIGMVEGFILMVLLFAPITSLTNTFQTISYSQNVVATASVDEKNDDNHLPALADMINENLPKEVVNAIYAYNNSVVGKIAGAGGIDDLLYDNMSKIDVNGQKVVLRQDLITGTKIYNDFAKFYNDLVDKKYKDLKFGALKANIDKLLDSGIFKGVIADTAEQFINHYEEFEFTKDMPELATNILSDLKTALETKEISFTEYLRNDLSKIADAGSKIFNTGIVEDYMDLKEKDLISILKFLDEKAYEFEKVADDLLETNIIEDCMSTFLKLASENVSNLIDGLEIKLNTEIEDIKNLLTTTKQLIPDFIELCEKIDLPKFLEEEDKLNFFATKIDEENLEDALEIAGDVLDRVRGLEILVVDGESTLDKVLEHYDYALLGGDVYGMVDGKGTKITLDTYTKFFNHIKEPIIRAKENGLLSGFSEDSILPFINAMEKDTTLIAKIVLPFKGMQAFDLESTVYTTVLNTLKGIELSTDEPFFDFTYLEKQPQETDEKNFERWNEAFETLGQVLVNLNQHDVQGTIYSYIEYVLRDDFSLDTLTNSLIDEESFDRLVSPIFASELFKPMSEVFIEKIDTEIAKITGLTSGTEYAKLQTDATAAATLQSILKEVKNLDTSNLDLQKIGEILTILQANAKNEGVFEKTFYNFIWYLTGDNLCGFDVEGLTPFEQHDAIKTYLAKDAAGLEGKTLYNNISFIDKFIQIEKAKEFGEKFASEMQNVPQISGLEDAPKLKTALENAVEGFATEEVVTALEELGSFVDKKELTDKIGENQEIVKGAIEQTFEDNTQLKDAFLKFLGLNG